VKKPLITIVVLYPIFLGLIYLFQDQIIFHEKSLNQNHQYHFATPFKEIWLESEHNIRINGLYFYCDSAIRKGIVVYYHGNADNLDRWGKYAGDFTKNGYDVLMIDYRGFGKSKGDFSEKGLVSDAQAAYNYSKKLFPENKIVVYGRSLGTGIATQIATANTPKLLLLETPFVNFTDVGYHFLPIFPYQKMSRIQLPTDKIIGKVKCPIHLFHGTADELVYYESSLKLCKILGQNPDKILTTIVGGKHKNLSEFPAYHQALDSCLVNKTKFAN
jgi:uncharacterized protein